MSVTTIMEHQVSTCDKNGQDETGRYSIGLSEDLFLFHPRFFFEIMISNFIAILKISRVVFPEVCDYPFMGNIGKMTVIPNVLHMLISLPVIRMKEAVVSPIEVERIYAELLAQG